MSRFNLEQSILSCWQITNDIDLLYKNVSEGNLTQDKLANILLGIKELYDIRFDQCFKDFESSLKG